MKNKEKQMIAILILVGVIIIGIIYFITRPKTTKEENVIEQNKVTEEYVQVLEDGTKLNTSTKLQEMKKLEGLEIGNIQLTYRNGVSVVLADVVNKSANKTELMAVSLTLLDKNGNVIEELNGLISELAPGASTQLNMGASSDYANAYDFTIVKK